MPVHSPRAGPRVAGAAAGGHDGDGAPLVGGCAEFGGVVGLIGDQSVRQLGEPGEGAERRSELVRLAGENLEVEQAASSVGDPDELRAKAAPRAPKRLAGPGRDARRSADALRSPPLPGRASAAFWCARTFVPST